MYDAEIGVVGAGPAGARAAELLAREGAEVLLLDPRAPWEKPCGGGLTASAFHDVPDLVGIQPFARRIDRVRLEASADVFLDVPLDDPLYVTARLALSRWQLERALQAGASFEQAAVKRVERAGGGWTLQLASGSGQRHGRTQRRLVHATVSRSCRVNRENLRYLPYQRGTVIEANRIVYLGNVDGFPIYADPDEVADVITAVNAARAARTDADLGAIMAGNRQIRTTVEGISFLYVPLDPYGCTFQPLARQDDVRKGGK